MQIGMNLLLWTTRVTAAHRPQLSMLKRLGYDAVEVPVFDTTPEDCRTLAGWLDELGLARTAVSICRPEDDPLSADPAVRARAVAANRRSIDCAEALGARLLCGPVMGPIGQFTGAGPTDAELDHAAGVLADTAAYAAGKGIHVALEFLNRFELYVMNDTATTARFCERVGAPNLGILYDTFHANIEEKDPAAAIRAHARHITHVHISENDRSTPGAGQVRWAETFAALAEVKYRGMLMVEAFGLALPELSAATRIWRRMFDSEEQLSRDALAFTRRHATW